MENKKSHVGEIRTMNNGEVATVIEDQDDKVTLAFESGYVKKDVPYKKFISKSVRDPWLNKPDSYKQEWASHFGIQVFDKKAKALFEEKLRVPNEKETQKNSKEKSFDAPLKILERIGEERESTYGGKMKIVGYHAANNIDVQFEDGTIVKNITYRRFQEGKVHNPNGAISSRVGKTFLNSKGQVFKVLEGHMDGKFAKFTIQFEDGVIKDNVSPYDFKRITSKISNTPSISQNKAEQNIGLQKIANCGQMMTIIAYRRNDDIDVQFEDGTIVKGKNLFQFNLGNIRNPNLFKNQHIGEINFNKSGDKMILLDYKNYANVTIGFENGAIMENRDYGEFKRGSIKTPEAPSDGILKWIPSKGHKETQEPNVWKPPQKTTQNAHFNFNRDENQER